MPPNKLEEYKMSLTKPREYMPSLATLPRELQDEIADNLTDDLKSLSSLSQVSRQFRAVAEPFLYKRIVLDRRFSFKRELLLCTLLDRNELALHIETMVVWNSFDYMKFRDEVWKTSARVGDMLKSRKHTIRSHVQRIQSIMRDPNDLGGNFVANFVAEIWCGHEMLHFESDNVTALIMFMARNIQDVQLHRTGMSSKFLNIAWQDVPERPFTRLRSVRLANLDLSVRHKAPLLATMTTLELHDMNIQTNPFVLATQAPATPLLRTLVLRKVNQVTPKIIAQMLRCKWLVNLKVLVVDKCIDYETSHNTDPDYHLHVLYGAMLKHTPQLQHFEWNNECFGQYHPEAFDFVTLEGLSQIRTLLMPQTQLLGEVSFDAQTISTIQRKIPKGVRSLIIEGYRVTADSPAYPYPLLPTTHKIVPDQADWCEARNLICAISDAFIGLHSPFSLRHLKLTVGMEPFRYKPVKPFEICPADLILFRYIADELAKVGFLFEVWKMPCVVRDEIDYEPLIMPGWTATLDHDQEREEHGQEFDSPDLVGRMAALTEFRRQRFLNTGTFYVT